MTVIESVECDQRNQVTSVQLWILKIYCSVRDPGAKIMKKMGTKSLVKSV